MGSGGAQMLPKPVRQNQGREKRYPSALNSVRAADNRNEMRGRSVLEDSRRDTVQSPTSAIPGGVDLDEMQSMKTGLST